jgi:hypothetical protein
MEKEHLEIYDKFCGPRFDKLESKIEQISSTVREMYRAIFNGFTSELKLMEQKIDGLQEWKRRRLNTREVWTRSLAITVGGGIFTALIVAFLKVVIGL